MGKEIMGFYCFPFDYDQIIINSEIHQY